MKLKITIILLLLSKLTFAQNKELGTWQVVNAQLSLSQKWKVFTELQARSNSFFNNFFYYEIKGGLSYSINNNFSFLVGTGRYATYADEGNFAKPFASEEFRIWQQVTMNQYLERLKIEHRYRAEQKWTGDGYRNRFRYRLNMMLPLNNAKLVPGTVYLNAYDEVFLNNKAPHFERNRFFAGAGYILTPVTTVQAGYVNQYNYSLSKRGGKNFLQLSLMLQFKYDDDRERIPNLMD
ncbi:DUF2490 domain-containing protein [Agriterribacter sp.]|uniref:DUF2490 domain-containing protein n=1 Tax=Agriterribacter sp. TaxID=2821509 RepID=UPI002C5DEEC3|nr:DUF2490 domain-containing protein [Agriterribacter sp.]HTN08951.1 DUF2490 domain-containing protein [Agriterribacter sp.]